MVIDFNSRFLSILTLFFTSFSFFDGQSQSGADITQKMFAATKEINTLKYKMKKIERIDGEMITQVSSVKLQRDPFMVYTRQEYPNDGLEVLYKSGDNTALINPNGFPWFNLKLDTQGSKMRKEQHHTIHDAGYDHVVSILEHLFSKYEEEIDERTTVKSTVWNDKACWQVEFVNPDFKYIEYTIKQNESIVSIADKYKLSGYMILEVNPDIDSYDDATEGQTIIIPNDYSPKMTLTIEKESMLPLVMKVYDDKGLYEHYQFSEINVNPPLDPAEFSEDYHEYGF